MIYTVAAWLCGIGIVVLLVVVGVAIYQYPAQAPRIAGLMFKVRDWFKRSALPVFEQAPDEVEPVVEEQPEAVEAVTFVRAATLADLPRRDRCTNMLALFDDEPVTPMVTPTTRYAVEHDPDVVEAQVVSDESSWSLANGFDWREQHARIVLAASGHVPAELIAPTRVVDDAPLYRSMPRRQITEATLSWDAAALRAQIAEEERMAIAS